ncbi:MAG: penicillin-binding protein 2 [Tissierellia bacterium]|nr:penicillin-binding protein 2 [Tissierellia bacterium]
MRWNVFNKDRKRILIVFIFLVLMSISMMLYLTYFAVFQAETVRSHPANRRSSIAEGQIKRGDIYDRKGELLATSEGEAGNYHRIYSYPTLYAHIIGYANSSLGKSGLESSMNDYLLNRNGNRTLKEISDFIRNEKQDGNSLILTLDTQMQSKARELLQENTEKGSIVLMKPKTGEVLAMASLPDFNAQTILEDWDKIQQSDNGALLNRSINGRYPPGSTFKVITAAGLLQSNVNLSYEDTGEQVIDGRTFRNAENAIYGDVDLDEALMYSLNTYFVRKGVDLGAPNLGKQADEFAFNQKIPFELPISQSEFDYKGKLSMTTLAASSIGQGNVLATPLQMAMVASAVANNGTMMKPYIVSEIEDSDGRTIESTEPETLKESIPSDVAEKLNEYLIDVVNDGSGKNARLNAFQVAGKTGTAENATGRNHAWFIGYGPAEDAEYAVAVILEEADESGGSVAAPIARDLLLYAYRNGGEDE